MRYSARCRPFLATCLLLLSLALVTGCNDSVDTAPGTSAANTTATNSAAPALPSDDALRDKLDAVIDFTQDRKMNTQDHAAWQVVHGILAYGGDLNVRHNGEVVSALDYLLQGGQMTGWKLRPGDHGLEAIVEPGTKTGQGHEDQWLGYLSQCGLELDQPIIVQDRTFTVRDLMTQAQWDIHEGQEATWTLMGLGTYLPLDAKWTAKDGTEWSIERIIKMESEQNLTESACGGSHRMYAICSALNRYKNELKPDKLTGGWLAADKKIKECVKKAHDFQQPDGTFSIEFFDRPATTPDVEKRLNTTGHVLEFLVMALSDEQLKEPWMTRSVVTLCDMLEQTREFDLSCGGLYHSAHGLALYRFRRFGAAPTAVASTPAESDEPPAPEAQ